MLKNSSDIRLSNPEFQNQCENETRDSSSSGYQNSFVNILFKNCGKHNNFPPGVPRQRLNGLKNGNNNSASGRSITTRSKSNESTLAPLDSYLVCGYAARKSKNSDSGCYSKNIESECEQNPQKTIESSRSSAELCATDSGRRYSQSKTKEATKNQSKVNTGETSKIYSETKLKQSSESGSSTCTVDFGRYTSKRKTEEDVCRSCHKSRKKFLGGCHKHNEPSEKLCGLSSKTKVKGSCETIPSTQTEFSCERPSKTSTETSQDTHLKTEDSSKAALLIKEDPRCDRWGYTLSSKVPERPLYTSTVFKPPHKHNLHKRYRKHRLHSRFKRRSERHSWKKSVAQKPCNQWKRPESKKPKMRSVRTTRSMVRKKRNPTNKYQKITEKAMGLFEEDIDERSPGEINIQSKWNALPANRKFYYLWIALGNDPLSEDPYQNYIKFTQHKTNGKISLADLEGWSCLPYNKRMLFITESFLARLFRTNEKPSEKLYKEYFNRTYKQYKANNVKEEQESDRVLGGEKRCLRSDTPQDSSVGQAEKKPKLEKSSCSF